MKIDRFRFASERRKQKSQNSQFQFHHGIYFSTPYFKIHAKIYIGSREKIDSVAAEKFM